MNKTYMRLSTNVLQTTVKLVHGYGSLFTVQGSLFTVQLRFTVYGSGFTVHGSLFNHQQISFRNRSM